MLLNPLMMTDGRSLFFRTLIEELHKGFVMLSSVVLHVQLIQFKDASIVKEGGAFFFLGDKVLPLPSLSSQYPIFGIGVILLYITEDWYLKPF